MHRELAAEFGDCVGEVHRGLGVPVGQVGMGVACEVFPVAFD